MRLFGRRQYSAIKVRKKELPAGLWVKCPGCGEIVYKSELESGVGVCPKCRHHFQIGWQDRLASLIEPGSFEEIDSDLVSADPLDFQGQSSYASKMQDARRKTGMRDAVVCGLATIGPVRLVIGVMDFSFMGGSMGSVVGEKITRLIERGTRDKLPVLIICSSGGARMYEGMLSLVQMAKTSAAVARHSKADLPYITVLTHPTTAGVMASYATLGDVIIAEPGALIGFAGPRVIRETTREEVPPGFQRSDFVLKRGLVDMIVSRTDLKATLVRLLSYMRNLPVEQPPAPVPTQGLLDIPDEPGQASS